MLLFEAKDLPTSETAPKLIYIIRLMLDQVNTPQATPKKLAMMSDLTASVHAKNEIGLEEYQVIVEKLSSTALAMLQTTCSRPTVGMLAFRICALLRFLFRQEIHWHVGWSTVCPQGVFQYELQHPSNHVPPSNFVAPC